MINKTTWKLTTQTVLNSEAEMKYGVTADDLGNLTFGLQIESTYQAMAIQSREFKKVQDESPDGSAAQFVASDFGGSTQ